MGVGEVHTHAVVQRPDDGHCQCDQEKRRVSPQEPERLDCVTNASPDP